MAQIAISGLRKAYGAAKDGFAVDGIDLTVEDGEVMALLGPSGCGKTTTLQLLAGFLTPDAGEIRVGNRIVSSPDGVIPPERRHMSLIFQSYAIWPHMTVFENVAFGLHIRKVSRDQIARRVDKVLAIVQLGHLAQRYPSELSGGQQQRVALARAIVVEPDILLLDEPLSNLDANLREEMRFEIRRLHDATGITMVYVTHDQAEAMVTSDRIALMNAGRIEQVGTPAQIYEEPATAFAATFIGRTNTIEGTLLETGVAQCFGVTMRAADSSGLAKGSKIYVCVRPHQISLSDFASNGDAGTVSYGHNRIGGRIARQTYLGEARDYLIELDGGSQVRVLTQASDNHPVGSQVLLNLPIDACRVVPNG